MSVTKALEITVAELVRAGDRDARQILLTALARGLRPELDPQDEVETWCDHILGTPDEDFEE